MSLLLWLAVFSAICLPGAVVLAWARHRGWPPWTSLATGIAMVCTVLFTVEHAVGLGNLRALGGLLLLASAGLAVGGARQGWFDRGLLLISLPFFAAVAVGLLWRGSYPSLFPSAERLTDLYFIVNYLEGAQLPPVDHWMPPYAFDFYYALQHYGAALMARLFGLSPGGAYNVAFVLLMALTPVLTWELARRQGLARGYAVLLLAVLMVGGTGASVWTRLVATNTEAKADNVNVYDRMAGSARFIGNYDQRINTPLGLRLFGHTITEGREWQELPLETFGYQFYIGDYHPPISGYFLLALALSLMWAAQSEARKTGTRLALAGLAAATVPLTIAAHAWIFPLHAVMVGVWGLTQAGIAWRGGDRALAGHWVMALVLGGLAVLVLLLPFLAGFSSRSLSTPVAWVTAQQHTPLVSFLALMMPILVVLGLSAFAPRHLRSFVWPVAAVLGLALVASEFIYIDDLSGGRHERTNTTMKWWGWIWVGTLIAVAPAVMMSPKRWVRGVSAAALALTLFYVIDIVKFISNTTQPDLMQLHGDGIYRRDAGGPAIIDALKVAPRGVVLERVAKYAYDDGTAYSMLAGQPVFLGWPLHEVTWRGQLPEIWSRHKAMGEIFEGTHADPVPYLLAHDVRYIVWSWREAHHKPEAREVLDRQLASHYQWRELARWGDRPLGLWTRRE